MIRLLLCLYAGLALSTPARAETDAWLTQPADPSLGTRAPRYAPVTAGVKRFRVVEPQNWLELNRAAGAPGGPVTREKQPSMRGMPSMGGSMPGMKMDGGRMP